MNIYLDDDSVGGPLVSRLRKTSHRLILPTDVGNAGAHDPIHLTTAIQQGFLVLTRNEGDFEELHDLILASGGSHPGILLVRFDSNQKHNMKPQDILGALAKLEASGFSTKDQLIVLNHWQ